MADYIFTSPNKENILVGRADMWVNGVNVGHTQGGFTLRKSSEYLDIISDQAGGKMKKVRTQEMLYLTTTMLESSIANLKLALNEPAANEAVSGSLLIIGDPDLSTPEHVVLLKGVAPGTNNKRWYQFWRCVVADDLETAIGMRDATQVVQLGFEILKDDTRNNAFGLMWDEDAGTTADPR